MTIQPKATLKTYFEAGDVPTETQFANLIDSSYVGEGFAAAVSAVGAGSTGIPNFTSVSAASFIVPGSAGGLVLQQATLASARTTLGIDALYVLLAGDNTIVSTDAGAAQGPTFNLYRNSASPAASDVGGGFDAEFNNSLGAKFTGGKMVGQIVDPTAASEDARLRFETTIAGAIANRLYVGAGLYTNSATGGDKGVDTINATGFYEAGEKISQFKVGAFTRNIATASGTQAVTGVGFTPKAIHLLAAVNTTPQMSSGISDGTTHGAVYDQSGGNYGVNGVAVELYVSAGNLATAVVTSFDADGFTLTWTKTGSPTGSAEIKYKAER